MSVADWIRKAASAESKRLSMKLYGGMMPEGESMLVDLAQLAAIQHEFVRYDICPRHMIEADDSCSDKDCLHAQPVFHAAKAFKEKYE